MQKLQSAVLVISLKRDEVVVSLTRDKHFNHLPRA